MAGSVNKVILLGNVGGEPDIRVTTDGKEIANFSLATNESWTDRATGERKEKTEWHRVVVFNPNLVKIIKQYIKKGHKIYIEGGIQTRKWTDQSGIDRYSTEIVINQFNGSIVMLGGAGSENNMNNTTSDQYSSNKQEEVNTSNSPEKTKSKAQKAQNFNQENDGDDEIPF